jgi:hypothetical protein
MPKARKTSSIGAPTRREISPAMMLRSPSAPPSRISACAFAIAACPSAISSEVLIPEPSSVVSYTVGYGEPVRETA